MLPFLLLLQVLYKFLSQEILMAFMIMLLISQQNLEIFQLALEQMLMFQKLTVQTERLHFAMEKELMEFQMLAADVHSQCATVFQEPTDNL